MICAIEVADSDAAMCRSIGVHGLEVIRKIQAEKAASGRGDEPVNILTHCNAGWLAFVDYGSATAPIYAAHRRGGLFYGWVDETRPRAQGAALTAWELGSHGVSHDVIVDNAIEERSSDEVRYPRGLSPDQRRIIVSLASMLRELRPAIIWNSPGSAFQPPSLFSL